MTKNLLTWVFRPGIDLQPLKFSLTPTPQSLDEATSILPQGAYTTLRTYNGNYVIKLHDHFQRLEEAANLSGTPIKLDYNNLRQALKFVNGYFDSDDKRIRIILDLSNRDLLTIYFITDKLVTPSENDFKRGVKVITWPMQRKNPRAKLTEFINQSSLIRQNLIPTVNEVIMVNSEGKMLEGLSSNFFGVVNGIIHTADEGVLYGITRSLVIDVIHGLGYPLSLEAISEKDIPCLEECFITSTSRSVLPVTEINGITVGTGMPGKMTLAILEEYHRTLPTILEPIDL